MFERSQSWALSFFFFFFLPLLLFFFLNPYPLILVGDFIENVIMLYLFLELHVEVCLFVSKDKDFYCH